MKNNITYTLIWFLVGFIGTYIFGSKKKAMKVNLFQT